jgi:moderate conductance mechanosensitive channel
MVGIDETPFVTAEWWRHYAWALGITLLIPLVVTVVSRRWRRAVLRRSKAAGDDTEGRRLRRVTTVVGLLSGTIIVVAWFVFVLMVLAAVNVNIAPILASAGIAGIALGFGAQTLVRDTISGLFIFLEGQFDIGDIVDLTADTGTTVSGTIESLSLRVTAVRQFDGSVSVIPNGSIHITNNRTRGWGRAVVDVRVALTEDAERVREVLLDLFHELEAQPPLKEWLRQPPQVLGVTQLTDTAQVIRAVAETQPTHRVDAERLLRERIIGRFAERGIKVPPIMAGVRSDAPGI